MSRMSCGRWRGFVTQPVSPPIASGCSRVRAAAAPISKSATSAWRSRPTWWWTSPHIFIGAGQIGLNHGQLRNPDNPDHILESAAADKFRTYRDTYRRNRHVAFLPACMSTSGRILGELLRLIFFLSHQKGGRLFCGPWLSAAQTRGLSPSRRFLLAKQVLHQDGMCSGCGFA